MTKIVVIEDTASNTIMITRENHKGIIMYKKMIAENGNDGSSNLRDATTFEVEYFNYVTSIVKNKDVAMLDDENRALFIEHKKTIN